MAKENGNNKPEKRNDHSFYKEANKSFMKDSEWTPKRVGSVTFKVTKWILFGFLIVSTLWGCVNEFIIHTSHNLGQGVEFYQKNDFVYPNMYQGVNIAGYSASKTAVTDEAQFVNSSDSTFDASKAQNVAFDFKTVNPNFGLTKESFNGITDEQFAQLKTDQLIIDGNDIQSYSNNKVTTSNLVYEYNPNILTFSDAILYDGTDVTAANDALGLSDGLLLTDSTLPTTFKTDLNGDDKADVTTWTQFALYEALQNEVNLTLPSDYTLDDFFTFKTKDGSELTFDQVKTEYDGGANVEAIKEVVSMQGEILPANNDGTTWTVVRKLDNSNSVLDEAKALVNIYAFNSGLATSDWTTLSNLDSTLNGESMKIKDAVESVASDNSETLDSTLDSYKVDYTKAAPVDGYVYGGAQTMVIPISKGFPIDPTDQTKQLISTFRENNPEYYASKDGGIASGFDTSVQNYGWTVLDQDGNLFGLYNNQVDAQNKAEITSVDNALYANQRTDAYGAINTFNGTVESASKYIFDEKVKTSMEDKWMNMQFSLDSSSFFGNELSFDYGSKFAGMIGKDQVTTIDSSFTGTIPTYSKVSHTFSSGTYDYEQNSLLARAIQPTGQDATNSDRVIFQGWSDWGKAWNIQYGPLYGAFVFPLAQLSMAIGEVFNYAISPWGTLLSIFIIVFLLRGIGALMSIKGTANQMKMQEVQTQVAKIKAKYEKYDLKQNKQMKQKQQMEIMALYRKNDVNPMGSIGTIFITMPIFLSLWIIISSLPAYKIAFIGQFAFSVSPFYGMFNLGAMFFLYLLVGITVGLVQGVSSKLPNWLSNKRKGIKKLDEGTKAALKKQNKTQNIMVGVFIVMGLTVPVLLAFYWIVSGLFTISLEVGRHIYRVQKGKKVKSENN